MNQMDGLSLTKKRLATNKTRTEEGGAILFNPSVTERGGITEAFRIFTGRAKPTKKLSLRARRGRIVAESQDNRE